MVERFQEVVEINNQVRAWERRDYMLKHYLVGMPLNFAENFIENFFAYTVGFQWFTYLTERTRLRRSEVNLPIVSYVYTEALIGDMKFHHFSIDRARYKVNILNFWQFPLNYVARTLGKAVGWLIVSPFTVPTFVGISVVAGVVSTVKQFGLNSKLAEIPPVELATQWASRNQSLKTIDIAKRITAHDFARGMINALRIKPPSHRNNFNIFCAFKSYFNAKSRELQSNKRWALAKTMLSGLALGFPLFFTVPWYKKKTSQIYEELVTLHKYGQDMRTLEYKNDSCNPSNLKDDDIYQIGLEHLDEKNTDFAFTYLSTIKPDFVHYTKAMNECGNILFAKKEYTEASQFFGRAGNLSMVQQCESLTEGKRINREQVNSTELQSLLKSINKEEILNLPSYPNPIGYGTTRKSSGVPTEDSLSNQALAPQIRRATLK